MIDATERRRRETRRKYEGNETKKEKKERLVGNVKGQRMETREKGLQEARVRKEKRIDEITKKRNNRGKRRNEGMKKNQEKRKKGK